MPESTASPVPVETQETPAIPYRPDDSRSAADYGAVLVALLLSGAALVAPAYWAQRRGWISPPAAKKTRDGLDVIATRQIGRATRATVLRHQKQHFLVVDAPGGLSVTPIERDETQHD